MRLYIGGALVGIALVVAHPVLRAQESTSEKARAIAAIKKLGGTVEVDTRSPGMPSIITRA